MGLKILYLLWRIWGADARLTRETLQETGKGSEPWLNLQGQGKAQSTSGAWASPAAVAAAAAAAGSAFPEGQQQKQRGASWRLGQVKRR